jgi:hypothetical protein
MAIIPEQQVQTSTLRGVDPTQFLQQAYREQQANVAAFNQMNTAIQQEAQKFIQKQGEKKQKEMTYNAVLPYAQQMTGGDPKQADALAQQIATNPTAGSAIVEMMNLQSKREEESALAAVEKQIKEAELKELLQPAIDAEGEAAYFHANYGLGATPEQVSSMTPEGQVAYLELQKKYGDQTSATQEVARRAMEARSEANQFQANYGLNAPPEQVAMLSPDAQVEYLSLQKTYGDKTSEAEQEIARLIELGYTRQQAIALKEGLIKTEVDPVTKQVFTYNVATGQQVPVTLGEEAKAQIRQRFLGERSQVPTDETTEPSSESLAQMAIESTGIIPSLVTAAQKVMGQFGVPFFDAPQIVEARQTIAAEKNTLLRALSANPRFPVAEMKRLQKEIDIEPSAFNDPVSMKAKLIGVKETLERRLENERSVADDATKPPKQRADAEKAMTDIQNFLNVLGDPEAISGGATGSSYTDKEQALLNKYL